MKVVELLERRRRNWQELDQLCERLSSPSGNAGSNPMELSRFTSLYRAALADLAMADAYQLPNDTIQYLNQLVGRAHNLLYRSKRFDFTAWGRLMFVQAPLTIITDPCFIVCFILFWSLFFTASWLGYDNQRWPGFADSVLGEQQMRGMEENFKSAFEYRRDGTKHTEQAPRENQRGGDTNAAMAGFYIEHNAGIGLQCFALGLLVLPGIYTLLFNAISLGAAFGYMARPDISDRARENFFNFVTAHGPFELTAITVSAGAGLRLGMAWLFPGNLSRLASLKQSGKRALPMIMAAVVMFICAAFIEGFVSPTDMSYWIKVMVAWVTGAMLVVYFAAPLAMYYAGYATIGVDNDELVSQGATIGATATKNVLLQSGTSSASETAAAVTTSATGS